jgi:AraC-like DNA-binding protein
MNDVTKLINDGTTSINELLPILPKGVLNKDYQLILLAHQQIMSCLYKPMPPIEQLAKQANMSETKFRGLFKRMYRQSIYQYHLAARLQLAKELLAGNDYTVTQIGYKVGFSHPSAFITIFQKHTGLSPAKFREQKTTIIEDTAK